jgi:hypothetical protein
MTGCRGRRIACPVLATGCGSLRCWSRSAAPSRCCPGLTIYRGLFATVVQDDLTGGLDALVGALAIGLALAAGVSLGKHLGRPLSGQRDRFDRRVRRRATTQD